MPLSGRLIYADGRFSVNASRSTARPRDMPGHDQGVEGRCRRGRGHGVVSMSCAGRALAMGPCRRRRAQSCSMMRDGRGLVSACAAIIVPRRAPRR